MAFCMGDSIGWLQPDGKSRPTKAVRGRARLPHALRFRVPHEHAFTSRSRGREPRTACWVPDPRTAVVITHSRSLHHGASLQKERPEFHSSATSILVHSRSRDSESPFVVALDPGHGGSIAGAHATRAVRKH